MHVREFDYELPSDLIAQEPAPDRSAARLLILGRETCAVSHGTVSALPDLLEPGDLVVVNNTRVFPARLLGRRVPSGGSVECLLIARVAEQGQVGRVGQVGQLRSACGPHEESESAPAAKSREARRSAKSSGGGAPRALNEVGQAGQDHTLWEALMHPGQKLRPGARVVFEGDGPTIQGEVLDRRFYGRRLIRLWTDDGSAVDEAVDAIGHVPLPPYIKRDDRGDDRDRYQTIFARARGSVAAPTAGLHFSAASIDALAARGVEIAEVTLHVGYGTFQPVRVEEVEDHRVESERYEIDGRTAARINEALDARRRVVAVGTTTTRALEASAQAHDGRIGHGAARTDLFIFPGFQFRVIRGLLTNFHLPRSSLLMLVSAFAGRECVFSAYQEAIERRYRFYSYGDAMLII